MPDFKSKYYTEQIITYIGNKRTLLKDIDEIIQSIKEKENKEKLDTADLFSGSGVVARLLKNNSNMVITNDLETYSKIINECFLSNKNDFNLKQFNKYLEEINRKIEEKPIKGIISKLYSPKDDLNIEAGERVFYTNANAMYIDSFRHYIDEVVPEEYKKYFLALLITEASIHVNTGGVFKGFYKDKNTGIGKFGGAAENALSRIKGEIVIKKPVLSNNYSKYQIYQEDAVFLSKKLPKLDLVYLDPPYNQHPYGSNYFMLNLIIKNEEPQNISRVSGIPNDWNHSVFNKKNTALSSMDEIIKNLNSKYILISYNNEGFISFDEMKNMLMKYGNVETKQIKYNTFRGSRNLRNRDIHTKEYLFLLEKEI